MDDLETLKRKRSAIKTKETIFSQFIDDLKVKNKNCITVEDYIQLYERLARFESLDSHFEEIQNLIESASQATEADLVIRGEFEQGFYSLIASAKHILKDYDNINDSDGVSERASIANTNISEGSGNRPFSGIKLPTIQLPIFDGSYEKWLEFRDTFDSLIHMNSCINNIQKFHYLRAALKGGAAQVIGALEFTADSYNVAWTTLKERYNNTRLLVHNHVKSLFNIESIRRESAEGLRKLIDNVSKHLRSLEQLDQPTSQWDTLVVYMVATKLDSQSLQEWEKYKAGSDVPTLEQLKSFLKNRADLLETLENNQTLSVIDKRPKSNNYTRGLVTFESKQSVPSCAFCKDNHYSQYCEEFKALSVDARMERVKSLKICINCLRPGHFNRVCRSSTCKRCGSKHHSLLHSELYKQNATDNKDSSHLAHGSVTLSASNKVDYVLLPTALVRVQNKQGSSHTVRALLDNCSQSNYVTQRACKLLNAKLFDISISIGGIGGMSSLSSHRCEIAFSSLHNQFTEKLSFLVLPQITGYVPNTRVDVSNFCIPKHLPLADPSYFKPREVDMLLGADIFWRLLCNGQYSLGPARPILRETKLGWIVTGSTGFPNATSVSCNFAQNLDVQNQLAKFWEIEEMSSTKALSLEESECQAHFDAHFRRDINGRFIVKLPLKGNEHKLGESYNQAKQQFLSLERRLKFNPNLSMLYTNFMSEYEVLGHMKKISTNHDKSTVSYYMPHHGVLREDSLTTKLRFVFNASYKTTSGLSLNDLQMVGPVMQQELFSILLRFRKHAYVISADIAKMYRQILVDPDQRSLQRILWRSSPLESLNAYEMSTVTYGQAALSFLAIRCLFQLAKECKASHPDIARILEDDFYVDDMLTGADTVEEAAYICSEITAILERGCFPLRKFYSNDPLTLRDVPNSATNTSVIKFGENETAKTLGLSWSPLSDRLTYRINSPSDSLKITKRTMLSEISRLFDPLGLLSPCIITAKIMLQKLWLEKLSWDDPLPRSLNDTWYRYRSELLSLQHITIQRRVICPDARTIELHGFSDASENAYGGCMFIRSLDSKGEIFTHLLCAKSKVAPLKCITLPRMELSGALVLARLTDSVLKSLKIHFDKIYLWTDSTIVLGWLRTPPNKLKTFVSNRVSEIHQIIPNAKWSHVSGKDNPADLLSRGVNPTIIKDSNLWWLGPPWLSNSESQWPNNSEEVGNLPDLKKETQAFSVFTPITDTFVFENFSSLRRIQRTTAYVLRFINNCKSRLTRKTKNLSVSELNHALSSLIKIAQRESFSSEIARLEGKKELKTGSRVLNLNPFVDACGVLRVGGRLENSEFPYDKQHPIILCSKHRLTKLIFLSEHNRLLHAGPQLLLASMREKFWPIGGRYIAKNTVRQCIKCFRHNAKSPDVIMGNLPSHRVQPKPPFDVTGVDYAGPFLIKDHQGRGCKISKCYVSLFVCFVTKAIHLDLVTSLTKEAFIMTMRRFCSRRGKPTRVFSDNGTNFVGAHSQLKELGQYLANHATELSESFANESVEWIFIPPHSPHFGGLWEAGVKSIKHHLKRVLGLTHLTFESLYTLLVQVEAIVNSRPISPLSSCPTDLLPLTPGHFLIGRPLTSLPSPDVCDLSSNRLSAYQHLQKLWHHIWIRWSKEYINELQVRKKWKTTREHLKIGTLVLIREDNLPPLCWQLGRVVELHPGSDGISRVVSLRTARGLTKRAYSKICPLPIEESS